MPPRDKFWIILESVLRSGYEWVEKPNLSQLRGQDAVGAYANLLDQRVLMVI
jgi:hypothetical protein